MDMIMTNNLQSAAITDRGLSEKRPQNEDSFLEMPSKGLFAVADGVGGAQAGDVASQMAMEILQEAFANSKNGDAEELMRIAIERANEAIYQMSHDLPQLSTMATTVVALHVDGNIATIGHVGDSRLYRLDPQGNLFRETNDHSVVEEEVRAGRMTPAQAAVHPSRNVISRALGAETVVDVELKTIMFEPNTIFLLCSDGITRHIEDPELRQLLTSDTPLDQVCEDMKHICYSRGAEDNLTAVIVRMPESAAAMDSDFEENTITASRPPLVSNAAFEHTDENTSEIPAQNLETPAADTFQAQSFSDETELSVHPSDTTNGVDDESKRQSVEPVPAVSQGTITEEKAYPVEERRNGSAFGKLLGSLALLLIGAALGAGGYHFWRQSQVQAPTVQQQQQPPQITQMQTPNIAYSAFENSRRSVDLNPEQYIAAHGATADNAEDFYLLGRAYLLVDKYKEAWSNFDRAKQLLSQTDTENKTMLANEIALGISIVNVEAGRRYFKNERQNLNQSSLQNTNVNSAMQNINGDVNTEIKPLNGNSNSGNP
jgi:serine/threonine protein phosphatase PrpC